MDKNELWRMIQESEKKFERRKFRRMIFAILVYSVAYFVVFYMRDDIAFDSFLIFLLEIAGCIFIGFISFLFNALIWIYLCKKSEDENKALEYLRKRLKEKEQEENYKE
jgi:hypothetical protein